mgnify:FL=1|tara:strand:- start:362 stop:1249 length:888 start_codon:yes stop_codon:yes gene_type:complete
MAKKKKTTVEVETPQVENETKLHAEDRYTVEKPVVEEIPNARRVLDDLKLKQKEKSNEFELKDRVYYLKGKKKPLSLSIRTSNLFYFDEEKGYEREIKYCQNQTTCFVDEMKGQQRLEHVVFRTGVLYVPREKATLQKFLAIHPHNGSVFYEHEPKKIAETQLDSLVLEVKALTEARNIDIGIAEAIMRVEVGSEVANMSSKELRRDLLLFAKSNPNLFLELASDENVMLRNFGIKAVEAGIIALTPDQRHFMWTSNRRKVMTIPFDEHPYSALASFFKTDEGMEIYANLEKRLK